MLLKILQLIFCVTPLVLSLILYKKPYRFMAKFHASMKQNIRAQMCIRDSFSRYEFIRYQGIRILFVLVVIVVMNECRIERRYSVPMSVFQSCTDVYKRQELVYYLKFMQVAEGIFALALPAFVKCLDILC